MLSQQEMEDFMAVEAALDERDELAARRRNASDAAVNSIDPSDDLPQDIRPGLKGVCGACRRSGAKSPNRWLRPLCGRETERPHP